MPPSARLPAAARRGKKRKTKTFQFWHGKQKLFGGNFQIFFAMVRKTAFQTPLNNV